MVRFLLRTVATGRQSRGRATPSLPAVRSYLSITAGNPITTTQNTLATDFQQLGSVFLPVRGGEMKVEEDHQLTGDDAVTSALLNVWSGLRFWLL